jgi:hypothetical protein
MGPNAKARHFGFDPSSEAAGFVDDEIGVLAVL